jgi:hypothetical protein
MSSSSPIPHAGMTVRRSVAADKPAMLTSFKPLFGDWDYLPLVIDDWLKPDASLLTWVAEAGPEGGMLVAMAQADELEPGDWYLRGLRSNPQAHPQAVAGAVLSLARRIGAELRQRGAATLRYGTLEDNRESLRLARVLGFQEHFRLAHSWHPLPDPPNAPQHVVTGHPGDPSGLFPGLARGSGVKPAHGYFFTGGKRGG